MRTNQVLSVVAISLVLAACGNTGVDSGVRPPPPPPTLNAVSATTLVALMDSLKQNLWMALRETGTAGPHESLVFATKHDPGRQGVYAAALSNNFWYGIMFGGGPAGAVAGRYLLTVGNNGAINNQQSGARVFLNGGFTPPAIGQGVAQLSGVAGSLAVDTAGNVTMPVPIQDGGGGRIAIDRGFMSDSLDRMLLIGTYSDTANPPNLYRSVMLLVSFNGSAFTQTNVDGDYDVFGMRGPVGPGAPSTMYGAATLAPNPQNGLSNFQANSTFLFRSTAGNQQLNIDPSSHLQLQASGLLVNLNPLADPPGGVAPNVGTTMNVESFEGDMWEQNLQGAIPRFEMWAAAGLDSAYSNNHGFLALRVPTTVNYSQVDLTGGEWRLVGLLLASDYQALHGMFTIGSQGELLSGFRDELSTTGFTPRVFVTGLTNSWAHQSNNRFTGRIEMN